MDTPQITNPGSAKLRFLASCALVAFGFLVVPEMYSRAQSAYLSTRTALLMHMIESDLQGKEIEIDLRTHARTKADALSRDDLLKAFWVANVRLQQANDTLESVSIALGYSVVPSDER